ncbi:MAG: hypothetical protein ACW99X_18170 [Candidatus Thorarchaeota archaeon]
MSKIFFEVRMKHPHGIKTTIMCDAHASRCSKFPQQFLDFKISQKADPHCKWCDKDAAAKTRLVKWAADNGISKVQGDDGSLIEVEDWVDLMIAAGGDA